MAENKVNEVALNMVNSLRETNQAIAESIVAAQQVKDATQRVSE